MSSVLGRRTRLAPGAVVFVWSSLTFFGCGSDDPKSGNAVAITGRVFSLDTASPLGGAQVSAPGAKSTSTDQQGGFSISVSTQQTKGAITATSHTTAPVSKPAPNTKAHVELHAKAFDAQMPISVDDGGEAKTKGGAGISVAKGQLESAKGEPATGKQGQLSVAAPDLKKSGGLAALPGNFDAKQGSQSGKLSVESAVYASAKTSESDLKLKAGSKAKLSLHATVPQMKTGSRTLYRYDESTGSWVEAGSVEQGSDADGLPVYTGEVESFGWFAVGEFYDGLTCIRGCVAEQAEGVRVLALGLDHASELTTYTDAEGCFALDVRAAAVLSVTAQVRSGASAPVRVSSGSQLASASQPESCSEIEPLHIVAADDACPLGSVTCAGHCVDQAFDSDHCGACGRVCTGETSCQLGSCVGTDGLEPGIDAGADAGVQVQDGGSEQQLDAGDSGPVLPDAGASCDCMSEVQGPFNMLGCCTASACGSVPAPELQDLGFALGCVERNQPGTPTATVCPSFARENGSGTISLPGCCRTDNTCGFDTAYGNYYQFETPDGGTGFSGPVNLGLGCIRSDEAQFGAVGRSCAHGLGDADGDSIGNEEDLCPFDATPTVDSDGDYVGDVCDNCSNAYNPDQRDTDQDGFGDECEADIDNDGLSNASDNCPTAPNLDQVDIDADGFGDICDTCPYDQLAPQTDTDYDGKGDDCDNCPQNFNPDQLDDNLDGVGDLCQITH